MRRRESDSALIDDRFPSEALVVRSLRRSNGKGKRLYWQFFELLFDGVCNKPHIRPLFCDPWDGRIGNNMRTQPVTAATQRVFSFMKWPF